MKAAPQDQWKLLDLAETDRLIARRRHDRKVLPQLDELRKLAGSRQSLAEDLVAKQTVVFDLKACLLYTSPSPRDATLSRMPSSA